MTQRELIEQVAKSTGESIETIQHMGFSPHQRTIPFEERGEPLMVDWDLEDRLRNIGRNQF